tara:strand:+ start:1570 stop:2112 length:543 start_codon:yes stop_codon:yes gene_type:complete
MHLAFVRSIRLIHAVGLVSLAMTPAFPDTTAQAAVRKADEARIAGCINQAAAGRPWLEKALWGLRDQEAGWIGAEVRNSNGTYDLGPMQINTWWVPKIAAQLGRSAAEVRHWLRFDACFNVGAARWIFLAALRDNVDFWKAVGVYHSPTSWRQQHYALSVAKHMKRRFSQGALAAAESAP